MKKKPNYVSGVLSVAGSTTFAARGGAEVEEEALEALNTGIKQRAILAETRNRANSERHKERAREWARWQTAADPYWKDHPEASNNEVAGYVIEELRLKDEVDTVARRLKKPRKAG
jgi:hypothetical protein